MEIEEGILGKGNERYWHRYQKGISFWQCYLTTTIFYNLENYTNGRWGGGESNTSLRNLETSL